MKEQWKVVEQAPDYEISSRGRIRRITAASATSPGFILTPYVNPRGYCYVCLRVNKRRVTFQVHRLVAMAFLGDPNGQQVNHKNGDKSDNRAANLEYVSAAANIRHACDTGAFPRGERQGHAKLTADQVREIFRLYKMGVNKTHLAANYGVTRQAVLHILRGTNWRHIYEEIHRPVGVTT